MPCSRHSELAEADAIANLGIEPVVTNIVIADEGERVRLAREILAKCGPAAKSKAAGL